MPSALPGVLNKVWLCPLSYTFFKTALFLFFISFCPSGSFFFCFFSFFSFFICSGGLLIVCVAVCYVPQRTKIEYCYT